MDGFHSSLFLPRSLLPALHKNECPQVRIKNNDKKVLKERNERYLA